MFLLLFFSLISTFCQNLISANPDIYNYPGGNGNLGFGGYYNTSFKTGNLLAYRIGTDQGSFIYLTRFSNGSAQNVLQVPGSNLGYDGPYNWWKIRDDGKLFACNMLQDNSIAVFETSQGKQIINLPSYQNNYNSYLHFDKTGRYIYSLVGNDFYDSSITGGVIWDLKQQNLPRYFKYQDSPYVQNTKYWRVMPKFVKAPDGSSRLLTCYQNLIYIYNCETGAVISATQVDGIIYELSYDTQNNRILVALSKPDTAEYFPEIQDWWGQDKFRILSFDIDLKSQKILSGWSVQCKGICFGEDGSRLAVKFAGADPVKSPGLINLYKIDGDKIIDGPILYHPGPYKNYGDRPYEALMFKFNESGSRLISNTNFWYNVTLESQTVILWETGTGQVIQKITHGDFGADFEDVCYSEDEFGGSIVLMGYFQFGVWDI